MLSKHVYSGRRLPHHHTSYAALVFMLLISGILLSAYSYTSRASSTISAAIKGPAPTIGAFISSPTNNQHFDAVPITVTGTCPADIYVKIMRNGVFAGTTYCQTGSFSLQVDLVPGKNDLLAQDYDIFDRPGPATPAVSVFYDPPPPPLKPQPTPGPRPGPTSGNPEGMTLAPLTINSTTILYRGAFPFDDITWPIQIGGGRAPYALNVEWGDGKSTLYTSPTGQMQVVHAYAKAGNYTVKIHASDTYGNSAYLQLAAIINGKAVALGGTIATPSGGSLQIAWPLWITAFLMLISFWLGERYRKGRMVTA